MPAAETPRLRHSLGDVRDRVLIGTAVGLFEALGFSVHAVALFLLSGPTVFQASGATLGQTILAYVVGGAASGVLIGLLLPLGRWRAGATLIGAFALVPFYCAMSVIIPGFDPWSSGWMIAFMLLAAVAGGILGWWGYSLVHRAR
jgi:hypothetical protein